MPITDEQYRIASRVGVTLSFERSPGECRLRHRIGLAYEPITRCNLSDLPNSDSEFASHRGKSWAPYESAWDSADGR